MLLKTLSLTSLLFSGAIFGFFYAWICSTMWGLDAVDPRTAITAMQSMNASVRNGVFAPAFFGTPFLLLVTAALAYVAQARASAMLFAMSTVVYVLGGFGLTVAFHIPMNEALALVGVPDTLDQAASIWADYSPDWQFWNVTRTVFCGLSLTLCGAAILALSPERQGVIR